MKRLLLSAVVLSCIGINAQVGIYTTEPKATLDITALNGKEADGLLMPRLTATELKAMETKLSADHDGLMIYVKEAVSPSERTGKYVKVDEQGYYYYDATNSIWKKLGSAASIYTAGKGIDINGNRISAQGLEKVSEGGQTGWRLIGADENNYGNIGSNAVDFSASNSASNSYGATGRAAVAMGEKTTASGAVSVAMGWGTEASGTTTVAIGDGVTAKSYRGVAFGAYNTPENNPEAEGYTRKTARLLSIGKGGSNAERSDAMTVLRNGKVGIGIDNFERNSNGEALLQVKGLIGSKPTVSADGSGASRVVVVDNEGVFKSIDKSALQGSGTDLSTINSKIRNIESQLGNKASEYYVDRKIRELEERLKSGGGSGSILVGRNVCSKNTGEFLATLYTTATGTSELGINKPVITTDGQQYYCSSYRDDTYGKAIMITGQDAAYICQAHKATPTYGWVRHNWVRICN